MSSKKEKLITISNKILETKQFKIVGRKHPDLNFGLNLNLLQTNAHRYAYIKKCIEKQAETIKAMPIEQKQNRKREVVVVIHDAWVNQYMNQLYVLSSSVKCVTFFNHTVCCVDKKPSPEQLHIDYYGLCWLYYFETTICGQKDIDIINELHHSKDIKHSYEQGLNFPKANLDIIVSLESWKYFLCMLIGLEFYHCIRKYNYMHSLYSDQDNPFSEYDIHVMSKEYGIILFPLKETLETVQNEHIKQFPNWHYLK